MARPRTRGAAALVILALLFVAVTVLVSQLLRGARLDLTDNGLYTLTDGTRRIARSLPEPVTLRLYFSRAVAAPVPFITTYAGRVRELLEEIAAASNGKVRLEVIDPAPFSEDEDRAAEFGLEAVPLGPGGEKLYFGLAGTNSTDGRATIGFFQPEKEQFLEYDIARLLNELAHPQKPVVGLLSTLPISFGFDPMTQQSREPWAIVTQMQQLFDVRNVAPTANSIPPDVKVLMLVHPKGLSTATLYAIDQFVMRGGRVLAFVDPSAEQDAAGADPMNPLGGEGRASEAGPLLAGWDIGFDPRQVIADDGHALTVSSGGQPVRHLGFLGFDAASFAAKDVITAGLGTVNFATVGFLTPKGLAGVTFEPLVSSSQLAAPIPAARFAMPGDPARLYDGFRPTGQRYVIAARITGPLKSAFPAGRPADAGAAAADAPPHLGATTQPANIVVVADSDVLADMLWTRADSLLGQRFVQAFANNGDFVLNALDNLGGSGDLIGIRGRASFARPFDRVEELRRSAGEALRGKEAELTRELQATEQKLTQLQSHRNDHTSALLTPAQEQELARFQDERSRVRKELREVRRGLDRDIEALGATLKAINIIAVPLAFLLVAFVVVAVRRRRLLRARP